MALALLPEGCNKKIFGFLQFAKSISTSKFSSYMTYIYYAMSGLYFIAKPNWPIPSAWRYIMLYLVEYFFVTLHK